MVLLFWRRSALAPPKQSPSVTPLYLYLAVVLWNISLLLMTHRHRESTTDQRNRKVSSAVQTSERAFDQHSQRAVHQANLRTQPPKCFQQRQISPSLGRPGTRPILLTTRRPTQSCSLATPRGRCPRELARLIYPSPRRNSSARPRAKSLQRANDCLGRSTTSCTRASGRGSWSSKWPPRTSSSGFFVPGWVLILMQTEI